MPAEPKFEVYKDHAEKFRWRLKASNDEEIASGQGYESKEGCMGGVESVKKNASKAKIVDMTK
ncbi:MAG: YegP family protein [Candidatus Bathyarchaeia archaeon]